MLSFNDFIIKSILTVAFILFLISSPEAECQVTILDSALTFRNGIVKTGIALNIISRQTGYYFTYDSKLIDLDKKTKMTFRGAKLHSILDSILMNDSLYYSIINKYIIISRIPHIPPAKTDSLPGWDVNYITGIIKDDENGEPLPYASIGLRNKGKGTVSNNNGEFGLKITRDCVDDSLIVSYLGYFNREIPVRHAIGNNLTISMKREYISIPEVIIRNQIPQEILRKSLFAIPKNYGNTPAYLTGFYREGIMKKNDLQVYSEAIIYIFKSAYSGSLLGDQMKIFKSRKIEKTDIRDTLTIRLRAGLSTCLDLDLAKNIFDFFTPENFSQYNYRMTDIVSVDEETAFVIEFVQKEDIDLPLFKGSLYINANDYAIMLAEFELNPLYIHKSKDTFVTSSSRGYRTWPVSVKYSVNYRKVNDRYFINHVRGDLVFSSRQKKKLFTSQFNVFFELAITGIDLKNVTRFDREELAPIHSVFSKTINSYDPIFWGDQDFLKPEDNLLQELKNLKVRLQEFSK
jgi:hypothetical protein